MKRSDKEYVKQDVPIEKLSNNKLIYNHSGILKSDTKNSEIYILGQESLVN